MAPLPVVEFGVVANVNKERDDAAVVVVVVLLAFECG
jgi:hypothetical protein